MNRRAFPTCGFVCITLPVHYSVALRSYCNLFNGILTLGRIYAKTSKHAYRHEVMYNIVHKYVPLSDAPVGRLSPEICFLYKCAMTTILRWCRWFLYRIAVPGAAGSDFHQFRALRSHFTSLYCFRVSILFSQFGVHFRK